ncbi:MAG TPA: exopolysaccharide Pel transporter PelG [Kofleriaceae bacterium]|nr:exopolysaccharide Pel transporter PelG [Kofleriaceae bacterium]
MAGIGWKLERIIERDTLGSSLGAMITGVAVTSGPWLLTTTLLVLMRISAVAAGLTTVTEAERVITVVYAVVIVLSAPIDIVLTRFSADCVYEKRRDRIAAPLCRVLAFGIITFAAVGAVAMVVCRAPLALAIPGAILAAVVGAQWLLVSAAGGLSSPGIILRAFAVGAPVSLGVWALMTPMSLGPAAYLYGFGIGQVVTLGFLLWGTLRALPAEEDDHASMFSAARMYWVMAAAAFAFNAGLWTDKLGVLIQEGGNVASQYAALAALAWLSVIPACAYLFVHVETNFHRKFHGFYQAIHDGAALHELEARAGQLHREVTTTLRGTAAVQVTVTLICLAIAPMVVPWLGLTGTSSTTIIWLLLGAGLQVVAVSSTLLLYYFDFQREALVSALTQLVTNTGFTLGLGALGVGLGAGYAAACAVTSVVSMFLLLQSMPGLLPRTFRSQVDLIEGGGGNQVAIADASN